MSFFFLAHPVYVDVYDTASLFLEYIANKTSRYDLM